MSNKVKKLSLVVIYLILVFKTKGSIVREDTPYQYYRDFAENRGIFRAGSVGNEIKLKDGRIEKIKVPIPDFSVATTTISAPGVANLIEGEFLATCAHNPGFADDRSMSEDDSENVFDIVMFGHGASHQYNMVSKNNHPDFKKTDESQIDFALPRLNKLVTEVAPLKRFDNFPQEYKKDPKRFTALARLGSGRQHILTDKDMDLVPSPHELQIAYSYLTGGFCPLEELIIDPVNDQILLKENNEYRKRAILGNTTTEGDSGSPLFVYDNKDKEWKWLGNAVGQYESGEMDGEDVTQYDIYGEPHGYVNSVINKYLVNINRTQQNKEYLWEKLDDYNYKINGTTFGGKGDEKPFRDDEKIRALNNGKDIVLTGGGTIILVNDVDQGAGSIRFKDNYTVIGKNKDIYWIGGGLNIDDNKVISWKIKGKDGDTLHKIGKGILYVEGEGENKGSLSLGDGIVLLDQKNGCAFNNIDIVSGRATLKLLRDNQIKDGEHLVFGYRGGIFDLNGFNFVFPNGIRAYDIGANLTNSNNRNKSKVHLLARDKEFKYNIYHGKITGNTDIYIEGEGKLGFDGIIDIPEGDMIIKKDTILQGHPTIHASTDKMANSEEDPDGTKTNISIKDKLKKKFNDNSLLLTPVFADQSDWENRSFKFNKIVLSNNGNLTIGRNSFVEAKEFDIETGNIIVGGKKVIIDENDGNGLPEKFSEKIIKNIAEKDRAILLTNINVKNRDSKIYIENGDFIGSIKNGSVNVSGDSKCSFLGESYIDNLKIENKNNKISIANNSKLVINNIESRNQNFELNCDLKDGQNSKLVILKNINGVNNNLKINIKDTKKDIDNDIILVRLPKNNESIKFFNIDIDKRYNRNLLFRENNDNYEWYLRRDVVSSTNKECLKNIGDILSMDRILLFDNDDYFNKGDGIWYKIKGENKKISDLEYNNREFVVGVGKRIKEDIYGIYGKMGIGKSRLKDGYDEYKYGGVSGYYTHNFRNDIYVGIDGELGRISHKLKFPTVNGRKIFENRYNKNSNYYKVAGVIGIRRKINNLYIEPSSRLSLGYIDGYKLKEDRYTTIKVKNRDEINWKNGIKIGEKYRGIDLSTAIYYTKNLSKNRDNIEIKDIRRYKKYRNIDLDKISIEMEGRKEITPATSVYAKLERDFGKNYKKNYSGEVGLEYKF